MISRNPPKFALEFFGKSILLLKTQDDVAWEEIGLADMGDPDFRETMKDFRAEVSAHGLRKSQVAVFLPLEDVIVETVTNDDFQQQLETNSGCAIDELAFVAGAELENATRHVFYAYRETLNEAQSFIAQFGFVASYFSARVTLDGFEALPKLELHTPKSKAVVAGYLPMLATAAVVAIGAFSLWAFSGNSPQETKQSTAASLVSVPQLPVLPPEPVQSASVFSASFNVAPTGPATPTLLAPKALVSVQTQNAPNVTQNTPLAVDMAFSPALISASISAPKSDILDPKVDLTPRARPVDLDLKLSTTIPTADSEISNQVARVDLDVLAVNTATDTPEIEPKDANYPRPRLRSGPRTTIEAVAVQAPVLPAQPAFARPKHRPKNLVSAAPAVAQTAQAAIAEDLLQQAITQDAVANDSLANASRLAKGSQKRPPRKLANFNQRVASLKSSPQKTSTPTTKPVTKVAAKKPTTAPAPSSDEKSTRASTTFSKRSLSLVGVFGTSSRRNALFRTAGGSYRSVKIGQRVSGWKIVAIGESSVKVTKGSRSKTMRVPQ